MESKVNQDLMISGSGNASGGNYDNVDISGSAKIKGDIECVKYKISGSAKVDGHVNAQSMKISGSSRHFGNVMSDQMDVSGSINIEGHAVAKDLSVSGSIKIGKHLSGEKVEASGSIHVKESCAVEQFKVRGSFDIGGLLNADVVDVTLYHDSNAREIGGGIIRVERGNKGFFLGKLFGGSHHYLSTDSIEGDELYLEYTKAKVVRGKSVRIGEGCDIGLVEYTGDYIQEGNARVGETKKL
jgi:cytoskeletal protein CcmA (bactofilin family)